MSISLIGFSLKKQLNLSSQENSLNWDLKCKNKNEKTS